MSAEAQPLLYEEQEYVGVITLNRPEAMNSMTYQLYAELEDTVRSSQARALVITGTGRAFCAGDDVKQILGSAAPAPEDFKARSQRSGGLTPAADALLHTDIPVIAAVNGPAVGWGMELALMADIRVASANAKFGELFVVRGLCCDAPGLGRLAQLVGRERAAELLFTGDVIDAETALQMGLVSRVVPHDEHLATAMAVAQKIARNPPLAVQALKAGLRRTLEPDWRDTGRWASQQIQRLRETEDSKEGVAAFLEKREPQYQGR
ncbi:MAG: enoyl-CoA hydratase/isomerase family protein [Pseudomonadota bacterium]